EAQHPGLFIDPEMPPALPAFGFAKRADDRDEGGRDGLRLGQRTRNVVLEPEQQFFALFLGDVAGGSAIAAEAALAVEHRLAAGADVARLALRVGTRNQEVVEGLARVEQRLVLVPAAAVAHRHGAVIPARGAEVRL